MQDLFENTKRENADLPGNAEQSQHPGSLFCNLLPFEYAEEPVPMVFTLHPDTEKQRFATAYQPEAFQKSVREAMGELPEFVYTDFNPDASGVKINIHLASCPAVARAWYTHRIRQVLAGKTAYLRGNFLRDTQFWCCNEAENSEHWDSFHKFTLRIQSDFISGQPELMIAYDGCGYLSKKSQAELSEEEELDTRLIQNVAYRKRIYRYDQLPDVAHYHPGELFPLINRELAAYLQIESPYRMVSDKFNVFYRQVDSFRTTYCSDFSFLNIIPHTGQWKLLTQEHQGRLNVSGRKLVFGQGMSEEDAYKGMKNFGPLQRPPGTHFNYFFIYFEEQEVAAHTLYNYLLKREGFLRMDVFTRMSWLYERGKNLVIRQGENPETKVREYLNTTGFDPGVVYFAFYISPYTRFEADEQKKKLYYRIKELLLYRHISMQAVEGHKLSGNFSNSMANISIALVAKLGGIPWRLEAKEQPELVIGFGAYRNRGQHTGYTGSAFCFSQDGIFREFEVFPAEDTRSIAGSALKAFQQYRTTYPDARRMIIHFYKRMSRRELAPLEKMLHEMQLDIPVVIVSVNKTPSKSLLAFDDPNSCTMPADGTWVQTGASAYLLNINLRKKREDIRVKQTFPLRLHFQCNREGYLEQEGLILELMEQVYAFSYLHWRSVRQSPLPVTVKYPSMIASFMPWFDRNLLPAHGKTKPWFL